MFKKENFKVVKGILDGVLTFFIGFIVCAIVCASALGSYNFIRCTRSLSEYTGWSAIGVFFAAIGCTAVLILLFFVIGLIIRSSIARCKDTKDTNKSKKILHS